MARQLPKCDYKALNPYKTILVSNLQDLSVSQKKSLFLDARVFICFKNNKKSLSSEVSSRTA